MAFTAFNFTFMNTLVAQTFNQGHQVAYELDTRHRVATLDGALFERTGQFTKGNPEGYKYASTYLVEGKKFKIDPKKKAKLQKELKKKENLFHEMQVNINNCQREIYRIKEKIPPEGEEYRLEVRLNGMKRDQEALRRYQSGIGVEKEALLKRMEEECQAMSDRSIAVKDELKQLKELALPMERQLEQLKEERYQLMEEQHQELERKMQELGKKRKHIHQEMKVVRYEMEKRNQIQQGVIEDLQRKKKQIATLNIEAKEMQKRVEACQVKLMDTANELKELKAELDQITKQKQEIKEIVEQRRLKAAESTDQEEEIKRKIQLEIKKIQRIRQEVEIKKELRQKCLERFLGDIEKRKTVEKMKIRKTNFQNLMKCDKIVYEEVSRDVLSKGKGISEDDLEAMIREKFTNLSISNKEKEEQRQRIEEQYLDTEIKLHKAIYDIQLNPNKVEEMKHQEISEIMEEKGLMEEMKEELNELERDLIIATKMRNKVKKGEQAREKQMDSSEQDEEEESDEQIEQDCEEVVELDREDNLIYLDDFMNKADQLKYEVKAYHNKMKEELIAQSDYNIFHQKIRKTFDAALPDIQLKIGKVYKDITGGGEIVIDKINNYGYDLEGLSLVVRPPFSCAIRKEQLSGGQKTLVALSVVFGLHFHRAAPFFLLDEVDANLDRSNVEMTGRYLSKIKSSQILMISHRREGAEYAPHFVQLYREIIGPMKYKVKAKQYSYAQALKLKNNPVLQLQGLKKKWNKTSKFFNFDQFNFRQLERTQRQMKKQAEEELFKLHEELKVENIENDPPDQEELLFYITDASGKRKTFNVDRVSTEASYSQRRQNSLKSREDSPLREPLVKGKLKTLLRQSQKRKQQLREGSSSDSEGV